MTIGLEVRVGLREEWRDHGDEMSRDLQVAFAAVQVCSAIRRIPSSIAERVASLNERTAQLLAYLLLVTKQVDVLPPLESMPPWQSGFVSGSAMNASMIKR